jgi:hypothetical protein
MNETTVASALQELDTTLADLLQQASTLQTLETTSGIFDFSVGALRRYHVLFSRVRMDAQTHAVLQVCACCKAYLIAG